MQFQQRFRPYFRKYFDFSSMLGEGSDTAFADGPERFAPSKWMHFVVSALRFSPWICALLLLVNTLLNFFLPSPQLENWGYWSEIVLTVSVGGLIGYGTNYLAIRMLFRPVEKRPLLGQGMIPAQRERIIYSLARGMHTHILSQSLIRKRLEESGLVHKLTDIFFSGTAGLGRDPQFRVEVKTLIRENMMAYFHKEEVRQELKEIINTQVEKKADKGLKKLVLNTYKRFNQEDYDALLDQIITDIPDSIDDVLDRYEDTLEEGVDWLEGNRRGAELWVMRLITSILNRLDIEGLLAKQMAHFDEAKLEKMVWEATNEQLLYIQYLGTVLGMLGGLVIWRPWIAGLYAGLALCVWGIDELWFRRQKAQAEKTSQQES